MVTSNPMAWLCSLCHGKLLLLVIFSQVCSQLLAVSDHSLVKFLPGFQGPLPFELETGYVGVGEVEELQLFYYFVKSEREPEEDPLMLWLTGGPGCSALSALLFEIGPLNIQIEQYNGSLPALVYNPYSWTKLSSIIFLDSPVGTGFSYARTSSAYRSGDSEQVQHALQFLRKWLADHPEFKSNPFYIGGDSYSGITVPVLVQHISNGNEEGIKPIINLQAYVLGNPSTMRFVELNSQIPFAHGMGLIPDDLFETYGYLLSQYWSNDPYVHEALGIRKGSIGKWQRCNDDIKAGELYDRDVETSFEYYTELSAKGYYRSLIYSGDHDMLLPSIATQAWIRSLNYSIVDDWRPWFVQGQIAGYTRTYSNRMTYATVKGAGHTAPEYKPEECLAMYKRWIFGEPLQSSPSSRL